MKDLIYIEKRFKHFINKYFCFQVGFFKKNYISLGINFNLSKKVSHAGFHFEFTFFKFYIIYSIYDNRHWENEGWVE